MRKVPLILVLCLTTPLMANAVSCPYPFASSERLALCEAKSSAGSACRLEINDKYPDPIEWNHFINGVNFSSEMHLVEVRAINCPWDFNEKELVGTTQLLSNFANPACDGRFLDKISNLIDIYIKPSSPVGQNNIGEKIGAFSYMNRTAHRVTLNNSGPPIQLNCEMKADPDSFR